MSQTHNYTNPGVDHDKLDHKEFSFEDGKNSLTVTLTTTIDSQNEGVEYLFLMESKTAGKNDYNTYGYTQLKNTKSSNILPESEKFIPDVYGNEVKYKYFQ